jgi:hypothetical protein
MALASRLRDARDASLSSREPGGELALDGSLAAGWVDGPQKKRNCTKSPRSRGALFHHVSPKKKGIS